MNVIRMTVRLFWNTVTVLRVHHSTARSSYLLVRGLPDIQQLSPEREHPVIVSPDHAQPADCQGLGRVSLGQDEGTER